jgi:riboflavin kinase/FMN adenylyltransferase
MLRLIRGLANIKETDRHSIATIGSFDGVHCGHQHLISHIAEEAKSLSVPSLLITFEPHPREFFAKQNAPARLTRLREKIDILQNLKLSKVLILHFTHQIAQLSAEDFIKIILVEKLAIRKLFVGNDFHFGKDRKGNIDLLKNAGEQFGFEVIIIEQIAYQTDRVSSSRIRAALAAAEFSLTKQLLGRSYWMCGRVIHGDKIGKKLGFPTANIAVMRKTVPLTGIFIVKVHGLAAEALNAVASIGTRPTINGTKMLLEVHLLDFNEDIYGRFIKIEFLSKIRDESRFDSLEILKKYIANDVKTAREFFTATK